MVGITHPVHEEQRGCSEEAVAQVVFDQQPPSRHSDRLPKERSRVLGVVEHIHKHGGIECAILVWNRAAVEPPHGNAACRANEHINPDHREIRPSLSGELGEEPIATPDVEDRCAPWKQLGENLAQDPHSSGMNRLTVQ